MKKIKKKMLKNERKKKRKGQRAKEVNDMKKKVNEGRK